MGQNQTSKANPIPRSPYHETSRATKGDSKAHKTRLERMNPFRSSTRFAMPAKNQPMVNAAQSELVTTSAGLTWAQNILIQAMAPALPTATLTMGGIIGVVPQFKSIQAKMGSANPLMIQFSSQRR